MTSGEVWGFLHFVSDIDEMLKHEVSIRMDTSVFSISPKTSKSKAFRDFLRHSKPFAAHLPLFLSKFRKDEKNRSVHSIGHFGFFLDLSVAHRTRPITN